LDKLIEELEPDDKPGAAPGAKTELSFEALAEDQAGSKWRTLYERFWPAYERWFLSEGDQARPRYLTAQRELKKHMPELLPTYERLSTLCGGGDLVARFLAGFCPPSYLTGCSQAVWPKNAPFLVRNYDYSPHWFEGVILKTAWNGKQVIAVSDGLWGVLDGINEDGLTLSLSFGGRRKVGAGFSVPLLLRYVLEIASSTEEAIAILERVPVHMSYNVTVLDRSGRYVTAYLRPDQPPVIRAVPYAANHQEEIEWVQHAQATQTLERERILCEALCKSPDKPDDFVASFLQAPLYSKAFARGYGTLYTAVYRPALGEAEFLWPGCNWRQSFAQFDEGKRIISLGDALLGDAACTAVPSG